MTTKAELAKAISTITSFFSKEDKTESDIEKSITDSKVTTKNIMKSVDVEKRLFTAVVLRPEVEDAHGHIYSEEVVEKACHDFTSLCGQGNIQHMFDTEALVPVENFIAKQDMTYELGDIKKGDWVMTSRVDNDTLWDMCKSGDFTGYSVGCPKSLISKDDE